MMQKANVLFETVKIEDERDKDNSVAKSCHEKLNLHIQLHDDGHEDDESNGHYVDVGEENGPAEGYVKTVHDPFIETSSFRVDPSTQEIAISLADPSIQENATSMANPSIKESMTSMDDEASIQEKMASVAGSNTQENVVSMAYSSIEENVKDPSNEGNVASMDPYIKEDVKSMDNTYLRENEGTDHVANDSGGESQGHQNLRNQSDDESKLRFSEGLSFSGIITCSGYTPHSGYMSSRSDSSTSTRSFAFPIIASDWSFGSPRKIGPPDMSFYKRRRRWQRACCCWCKEPTTLLD